MLLHNHQLALYRATQSVAETRRVWNPNNNNPNQNQQRAETNDLPDHTQIADKNEFLRRLEDALDNRRLTQEDYERRKREGKAYYQGREAAEQQRAGQNAHQTTEQTNRTQTVEERIRDFEENHRDLDSEQAIKEIKADRITSLHELRDWTRRQLEERNIKFEEGGSEEKKAVRKLQHGFMSRIKTLLEHNPNDRNHRKLLTEFAREDEQARRCYERIRTWATDGPRQDFLKFLARKEFPKWQGGVEQDTSGTGIHHSAQKIRFLSGKVAAVDPDKAIAELLSHPEARELHLLDDSLTAIDRFYDAWKNAPIESDANILRTRLTDYERKFKKVSDEIVGNEDVLAVIRTENKREWSEIAGSRAYDIKTLTNLLYDETSKAVKNTDSSDRKLVAATLGAYEGELKQYEQLLFEYKKAKRETEDVYKAAAKEEAATEKAAAERAAHTDHGKGHDAHEAGHDAHGSGHGDHDHHHGGESEMMKAVWKKSVNIFTAGGRITWYSFHDIGLAWHLVTDAFKKNAESVGEDKAGGLAKGLTHWRPVVEKRVLLLDLAAEKKRANEMKEGLKHNDYDKLVAELGEPPPKDKQRAILEILADRGVMWMSDKKLVNALRMTGLQVTPEEWKDCDERNDYTLVRERFKEKLAHHFHEPNYAQELLEKHNAGVKNTESRGKDLNSKTDATSGPAEFKMFLQQLGKAKLEGEGKVAGAIYTMMNRANLYTNNGNKVPMSVNVEGNEHVIERDCDMGHVGLALVDAWLKGTITREMLGSQISKGNESLFNPFAAFQDNLTARGEKVEIDGQEFKVSTFEKWGWIKEVFGQPTLTKLGETEIPKYLNTRAAKTKDIATGEEGYAHVSFDSGTYTRHSSRHQSIRDATKGDEVGDKLVSNLVKAADINFFKHATETQLGTGTFSAEGEQIAGLIKAGMEHMHDGKLMMENSERYYDKVSGESLNREKATTYLNDPVKASRVGRRGAEQMKLGKEIIVRVMENIVKYSEGRSIANANNQYRAGGKKLALGSFLEYRLAEINLRPGSKDYDDIMRVYRDLMDETKIQRIERNTTALNPAA